MTSPRPMPPAPPAKHQRRRPSQSRARLTAQALQQAFVQLLVESDYPRISIRAITGLAGTSLGSFYEYFASKEDLARVCLHLRSKELLTALQQAVEARRGRPLAELVQAVLASQLAAHRAQPAEWSAHYLLERHLSGVEAYRKMYQRFIEGWVQVIEAAGDLLIVRGAKGFTVADVAQRAHVGKGTVYLYWPTKEDLLVGLVGRAFLGLVDDRVQLKPYAKLIGQIACATIFTMFSLRLHWLPCCLFMAIGKFVRYWLVAQTALAG